jgi:lipid A 3-O-deacylase
MWRAILITTITVIFLRNTSYCNDGFKLERIFFEAGQSLYENTRIYRSGISMKWKEEVIGKSPWCMHFSMEAAIGQWNTFTTGNENFKLIEYMFTPVVRVQERFPSSISFFIEAAVGLHLLSNAFVRGPRKFGSAFQFGDHAGIGIRFGKDQKYELSYRIQHLSNAGISKPNEGMNFSEIYFAYRIK